MQEEKTWLIQDLPAISVIIPVFNEEKTIVQCLSSLLNGEYPLQKMEFIIADGNSTDGTRQQIERFVKEHPDVKIKVITNTMRTQGHGLNAAVEITNNQSQIVVRADAHSIYPRNYIWNCINTLLSIGADNIGGVMVPRGLKPFQRAVAFCMTHPLGVGNAKFHLGNFSGYVDTVYLGTFKKEVFKKAGLFDPAMTPNEDAELNMRIIESGGKIYLDKNIRVEYFPRGSIKKLIQQYFRYGQGRCRTFKKHKKFTSIRQVIPPLWLIFTLFCLILGITVSQLFLIPLAGYILIIFATSFSGTFSHKDPSILLAPVSFFIMHYAWGAGFIDEMRK